MPTGAPPVPRPCLDPPHNFFHAMQMYIDTNILLRERFSLWHGSFHETLGKGGTLLVGHGIIRAMIGHPIPPCAAAGIAQLDAKGVSAEELSCFILFLS